MCQNGCPVIETLSESLKKQSPKDLQMLNNYLSEASSRSLNFTYPDWPHYNEECPSEFKNIADNILPLLLSEIGKTYLNLQKEEE